jgi:L-ascorbate metabolism protein UlaG (beta-lactamase superfamily)
LDHLSPSILRYIAFEGLLVFGDKEYKKNIMKGCHLPYGLVKAITQNKEIEITWFGHSCFRINIDNTTLYLDPIRQNNLLQTTLDTKKQDKPKGILISHEHWDHCDPVTIFELCSPSTIIYGPESIKNPIVHRISFDVHDLEELKNESKKISIVKPNDILEIGNFEIKCLEAQEGLSYLLLIGDKKLLFMGDSPASTDMINEHPDIILFPIWAISGKEAKLDDFLILAQGSLCIPIHYHTISSALPNFYVDLKKIKELIPNVNIKILNRNETFKNVI